MINQRAFMLLMMCSLALYAAESVARVYKCDVNHKTVYSDIPCGTTQQTVRIVGKSRHNVAHSRITYVPVVASLDTALDEPTINNQEAAPEAEFIPIENLGFVKLLRDYAHNTLLMQVVKLDRRTPMSHFTWPEILLLPENGGNISVTSKPERTERGEIVYSVNHARISEISRKMVHVSILDYSGKKTSTTSYNLHFED